MGDKLFARGGNEVCNVEWILQIISNMKEGVHMKISCFTPSIEPLINPSHFKNEWNAWMIHWMETTQ
jgi:hypothetical protein